MYPYYNNRKKKTIYLNVLSIHSHLPGFANIFLHFEWHKLLVEFMNDTVIYGSIPIIAGIMIFHIEFESFYCSF